MADLTMGEILDGRYEVLSLLGRGGMGSVYKARQLNLDRIVAIKVPSDRVLANADFAKRFIREAHLCAKVAHPHIVAIFDVFEGEQPHIVMEYVDGMPLNQYLHEEATTLFVSDLLEIVGQVCEGLDAAHARHIVHRDIKPANIAITAGTQQVKIMDFGVARASDAASMTTDGSMLGTPYYMAPEQIQGGHIGPATDLYALAGVVHYLLTGRHVFQGEVAALLYMHVSTPPMAPSRVNPMLPPAVDAVLLRALEKLPQARQGSCQEFWRALCKAMRPVAQMPYSQMFPQASERLAPTPPPADLARTIASPRSPGASPSPSPIASPNASPGASPSPSRNASPNALRGASPNASPSASPSGSPGPPPIRPGATPSPALFAAKAGFASDSAPTEAIPHRAEDLARVRARPSTHRALLLGAGLGAGALLALALVAGPRLLPGWHLRPSAQSGPPPAGAGLAPASQGPAEPGAALSSTSAPPAALAAAEPHAASPSAHPSISPAASAAGSPPSSPASGSSVPPVPAPGSPSPGGSAPAAPHWLGRAPEQDNYRVGDWLTARWTQDPPAPGAVWLVEVQGPGDAAPVPKRRTADTKLALHLDRGAGRYEVVVRPESADGLGALRAAFEVAPAPAKP